MTGPKKPSQSRTDEELGDLVNYLLQFDFNIIYRPGAKNVEANSLSRNPVLDSSEGNDIPNVIPTINVLWEIFEIHLEKPFDKISQGVLTRPQDKNHSSAQFMSGRRGGRAFVFPPYENFLCRGVFVL